MDRCMTKSRRPGGFARVKLLDRMQIYGGGDRQDDSYRGAWWGMGEACLRLYARTSLTKSICGKNTWVLYFAFRPKPAVQPAILCSAISRSLGSLRYLLFYMLCQHDPLASVRRRNSS
jgi:hypothetical protein